MHRMQHFLATVVAPVFLSRNGEMGGNRLQRGSMLAGVLYGFTIHHNSNFSSNVGSVQPCSHHQTITVDETQEKPILGAFAPQRQMPRHNQSQRIALGAVSMPPPEQGTEDYLTWAEFRVSPSTRVLSAALQRQKITTSFCPGEVKLVTRMTRSNENYGGGDGNPLHRACGCIGRGKGCLWGLKRVPRFTSPMANKNRDMAETLTY